MGFLHNTQTLTTRLLVVVLLLLLLGTAVSASRRRSRDSRAQCDTFPRFRVNNVEPLALTRGHVTLVALLTSTCPFCLSQARKLQNLSESFQQRNIDVRMMIINGGARPHPGQVGPLGQRVSFPVYHDDDSKTIWWRVFHGGKDDIFIIDRCGHLTYRIPFPYSYLGYNFVTRAINRTLNENVCGCEAASQDLSDRMMGDAPVLGNFRSRSGSHRFGHGRSPGRLGGVIQGRGSRGGHSYSYRNRNRSRCPRSDELCRDMRRARRRYNLYRRQQGIHLNPEMREEQILGLFQRSQRGGSMGPVF